MIDLAQGAPFNRIEFTAPSHYCWGVCITTGGNDDHAEQPKRE